MEWKPDSPFPEEFHRIARWVYKGDPHWIPEFLPLLQYSFGSGNSFFREGRAWLDFVPGCARLAGFFDPSVRIDGKQVSFFGYWESKDSMAPNERLFASYEEWARKCGASVSYGPINFSTFGNYRIRLNRFEDGCFVGEPYNPPYYQALLENLNYRIRYRYMSYLGDFERSLAAGENYVRKFEGDFARDGITFHALTPEFWQQNPEKFFQMADVIFADNFAYTKISFEDFQKGFGSFMLNRFCRYGSTVALDKAGEIAGFFIFFPDYSPLVSQGAADPLSQYELSYEKHFTLLKEPLCLAKTAGVMPAYRRSGLFAMITLAGMRRARGLYRRFSAATVREDNPSLRVAKAYLPHPEDVEHIYALYMKEL